MKKEVIFIVSSSPLPTANNEHKTNCVNGNLQRKAPVPHHGRKGCHEWHYRVPAPTSPLRHSQGLYRPEIRLN
jgi:hypothetical protein